MCEISNMKRHLLSTAAKVPLVGDILDFQSTMAGNIFDYTKSTLPASAQAYALLELAKCIEKEMQCFHSHEEFNDQARGRGDRFVPFASTGAVGKG